MPPTPPLPPQAQANRPGGPAVQVTTKGQTVGLNPDLMMLLSNDDGSVLVTATRANGIWTIHANVGNVADSTATTRNDAISSMTAHAQAALGHENYTSQVQAGLRQQA